MAAPKFKGTAVIKGQFKDISLDDYKGKYVVLFFYPLDFTFVCPTEIIAFNDRAGEFEAINTAVIACSTDSQFSHLAWCERERKMGGLGRMQIPLLADKNMAISRAYGRPRVRRKRRPLDRHGGAGRRDSGCPGSVCLPSRPPSPWRPRSRAGPAPRRSPWPTVPVACSDSARLSRIWPTLAACARLAASSSAILADLFLASVLAVMAAFPVLEDWRNPSTEGARVVAEQGTDRLLAASS